MGAKPPVTDGAIYARNPPIADIQTDQVPRVWCDLALSRHVEQPQAEWQAIGNSEEQVLGKSFPSTG